MAGETYGSPGFAFSGAFDDFLLKQEARKHQALMDQITLRKEAREEKADEEDAAIRRETLQVQRQARQRQEHETEVKDFRTNLSDLAPGDIVDPQTISEGKRLGVPVRLGPIPQKPEAGVPASLAENPATIANTPMSPDANRPFAGSPQQEAERQLVESLPVGSPERMAAEYQMKTKHALPAGVLRVAPKPTAEPSFEAYGADGSVMPGIVSMGEDGKPLFNGSPLQPGVSVRRVPTPRDPLLEDLTRSQINKNKDGGGSEDIIQIGADGLPRRWNPGTQAWDIVSTAPRKGAHIGVAPGASAQAARDIDIHGAQNLTNQLDAAIDAAKDYIGVGQGRVSNIEQMMGSANPAVQALGIKMNSFKMQFDSALGTRRAAASPGLIKRWDNLLANKVDYEGLKASVQAAREILDGLSGKEPDAKPAPKKSIDELWSAAHSGGK